MTKDRNDSAGEEWITCPRCEGEGEVGMEWIGTKFVADSGRECPLCRGLMGFGDEIELNAAERSERGRARLRNIRILHEGLAKYLADEDHLRADVRNLLTEAQIQLEKEAEHIEAVWN